VGRSGEKVSQLHLHWDQGVTNLTSVQQRTEKSMASYI
jgi:hypothetical protein